MKCIPCPVPSGQACHGAILPGLCDWAASGDPVKVAHVVNRSALARGEVLVQAAVPCPPPGGKARLPLGARVGRR